MNRPFTIYFDTSFYIWLAKATDEVAIDVISKLNELKVRHVLSGKVLFELLSGRERNPQDKNLVKRVNLFQIEPLKISISHLEMSNDIDVSWDILLLDGDLRKSLSDFLKSLYDVETSAQSYSNLAGKNLSKDKEEKLNESIQPFLSSIGYDETRSNEENTNAFTSFASNLISTLSPLLPEEQRKKLEEIDFSEENSPENLSKISNQILNSLGSETVDKLEEEKKIIDSTVELDPRPYEVAINEASSIDIKRLGNTFRDAEHINLFITHQNEIDLIQIDSHQMNSIKRIKPKHRINELGLINRCFSAKNLLELIELVGNKKQEIYK